MAMERNCGEKDLIWRDWAGQNRAAISQAHQAAYRDFCVLKCYPYFSGIKKTFI
jgi:hypothetical protein